MVDLSIGVSNYQRVDPLQDRSVASSIGLYWIYIGGNVLLHGCWLAPHVLFPLNAPVHQKGYTSGEPTHFVKPAVLLTSSIFLDLE